MSIDAATTIITLAEAKTFLKIPGSTEDTILEALVDSVNKFIHTYCGRKFVQATYTDFYDGTDSDKIMLRVWPVVSVTSIHQDSNRDFAATSLLSASNYIVDTEAGIVQLWNNESKFLCGVKSIKVVYVAGFATMPNDLKHAAKLVLLQTYKRHYQDQRIGLQSETVGERTFSYSNESIPAQAKLILDRYRAFTPGSNGYGTSA